LARPLVLGAARVKENCFSLSFIAAPFSQPWRTASTGKVCRVSRGVRPPQGRVGGRWQLWRAEFRTTTQEHQESAAALAWERLGVLSVPGRRRLLAALHYFHVACRLSRQAVTVGEFLAEVVLNLAKALEALFPPGGDGRTRDAVRAQLGALGFSEAEIERDYLPAMALRNEIDVGHVALCLFKPDHLTLIHAYVDRAEEAFRLLFDRLLKKLVSGKFEIEPYELGSAKPDAIAIIERLR
jgi:hypothetical protein